jgi:uncharacterized cupredoxin-like copper-binding protein
MHSAALALAPILAAEKSKVPFYLAGGVLVAWALIVSLGLGLRRVDFPGTPEAARVVMGVTAILVLAAASAAVITSGSAAKAGAATGSTQPATASAPSSSAPAPTTPSTSTTSPKATTGTPAPSAPAPATATTSLKLIANPGGLLSYDAKSLSAKAGSVSMTLTNNAPLEHNVTVAQGAAVLGTTPTFIGGRRTLTLTLKPGTYTFYCSVPGHRQAGMEGTLNVS